MLLVCSSPGIQLEEGSILPELPRASLLFFSIQGLEVLEDVSGSRICSFGSFMGSCSGVGLQNSMTLDGRCCQLTVL